MCTPILVTNNIKGLTADIIMLDIDVRFILHPDFKMVTVTKIHLSHIIMLYYINFHSRVGVQAIYSLSYMWLSGFAVMVCNVVGLIVSLITGIKILLEMCIRSSFWSSLPALREIERKLVVKLNWSKYLYYVRIIRIWVGSCIARVSVLDYLEIYGNNAWSILTKILYWFGCHYVCVVNHNFFFNFFLLLYCHQHHPGGCFSWCDKKNKKRQNRYAIKRHIKIILFGINIMIEINTNDWNIEMIGRYT